jgi:hypothetical protein
MNALLSAIRAFEKAGEEVKNAAMVAAADKRSNINVEDGRSMIDRLIEGELNAARAERAILEIVSLGTAIEIVKMKLAASK